MCVCVYIHMCTCILIHLFIHVCTCFLLFLHTEQLMIVVMKLSSLWACIYPQTSQLPLSVSSFPSATHPPPPTHRHPPTATHPPLARKLRKSMNFGGVLNFMDDRCGPNWGPDGPSIRERHRKPFCSSCCCCGSPVQESSVPAACS